MFVLSELWRWLFSLSGICIALGRLAELASWHEVLFLLLSKSELEHTGKVVWEGCSQRKLFWESASLTSVENWINQSPNFTEFPTWEVFVTSLIIDDCICFYCYWLVVLPTWSVLTHKIKLCKMEGLFMDCSQPVPAVFAGAKKVKKEDAPISSALSIWWLSCWNEESVFCI